MAPFLTSNRIKQFDLHLAELAEFPQGDEFYGRVLSVQSRNAQLFITATVAVDLTSLATFRDIYFYRESGVYTSPPFALDSYSSRPDGQVELVLTIPGNLSENTAACQPGMIVTSNGREYPFKRRIRAKYDAETVTVYQAFNAEIAAEAVARQHFGPRFNPQRFTWVKPSFLWTMKRSLWATASGQEHILAIQLKRSVFHALLEAATLANPTPGLAVKAPGLLANRAQWDPEKDLAGKGLPSGQKTLQLGIHPHHLAEYQAGIVAIEDITGTVQSIRKPIGSGSAELLPLEVTYPTPIGLLKKLEMHQYFADEDPALIDRLSARLGI